MYIFFGNIIEGIINELACPGDGTINIKDDPAIYFFYRLIIRHEVFEYYRMWKDIII